MGNRSVKPAIPADYFTPYSAYEPQASVPAVHTDGPMYPLASTSPPAFSSFPMPEVPLTVPTIDTSSTPTVPVVSPPLATSITSPQRVISVTPPPLTVPVTASEPVNVALSPTPSTDDVPIHSANLMPVSSPDSSAVSPTFEAHISPVASPIPAIPSSPPVSIHVTSPRASLIPTEESTKVISPSTVEQAEPAALSSDGRWRKYHGFDQKPKELSDTAEETLSTHTATPRATEVKDDQDIIPDTLNIIAVPSFSLRSTAVCPTLEENYLLSERTQSIHADISIFKFYTTSNEIKPLVGNHTKATMFKMDTRLKKTPLPAPSLSFLSKNFNDDIQETNKKSGKVPTFDALGLPNDLQREPSSQSRTESLRSNKQRNDSPQYASTFMIRTSNPAPVENPSLRNNRQPLPSILKKRSSQIEKNPFPTEDFRGNYFDNNPSGVSLYALSSSVTNKASQSILRSHKLFHQND